MSSREKTLAVLWFLSFIVGTVLVVGFAQAQPKGSALGTQSVFVFVFLWALVLAVYVTYLRRRPRT